MKRFFTSMAILCALMAWTGPVWSNNPFTSKKAAEQKPPEPMLKSRFFADIVVWQHQLRRQMSDMVREARTGGGILPLLLLSGTAFAYGAIHAAGPGHGKFVAMSYFVSRKASIAKGLLFGFCVAAVHGFSGVSVVLGIRYVIGRTVGETLETVTSATQIVCFGLISALGLAILSKSAHALYVSRREKNDAASEPTPVESSGKSFLAWVLALGLVPCPAVVMAMLFCLSMDAMVLGFLLATCISLGMASTISFVAIAVIAGKQGVLKAAGNRRTEIVEASAGLVSGLAIFVFGVVFLLTAANATF